jgi:hypothetical protein
MVNIPTSLHGRNVKREGKKRERRRRDERRDE